MTDTNVLLRAEAAHRLSVRTRIIIEAMHAKKLPRVRIDDGRLGVPADALATLQRQTG